MNGQQILDHAKKLKLNVPSGATPLNSIAGALHHLVHKHELVESKGHGTGRYRLRQGPPVYFFKNRQFPMQSDEESDAEPEDHCMSFGGKDPRDLIKDLDDIDYAEWAEYSACGAQHFGKMGLGLVG